MIYTDRIGSVVWIASEMLDSGAVVRATLNRIDEHGRAFLSVSRTETFDQMPFLQTSQTAVFASEAEAAHRSAIICQEKAEEAIKLFRFWKKKEIENELREKALFAGAPERGDKPKEAAHGA